LTLGTRGDIQPMAVVADELQRRGHGVTMAVPIDHSDWATQAGIDVVPFDFDVGAFARSPDGEKFLATGRILAYLRELSRWEARANDSMIDACVKAADGADVIVATTFTAYRAQCLSAASGVPVGNVLLQPLFPTGEYAANVLPIRDLRAPVFNRLSYRLLGWRGHREQIDTMCDRLGIPRLRRRPRVELGRGIGLYSDAVVPRAGDLPQHHQQVGWPLMPAALRTLLGEATNPKLEEWLDAGAAPVYFGFGSMPVPDPATALADISRVASERGLRALVGAGWSDFDPSALPDHVFVAGAFDHDSVLPRCVAAVHHGGAGTTAAVLRAGIPSVVASVMGDQPFWGWRLQELGLGTTLPFRKMDAKSLGWHLDTALALDPSPLADVKRRIAGERAVKAACDTIESWASTPSVN
jgi:sterol 3beta-glucosyltransferase